MARKDTAFRKVLYSDDMGGGGWLRWLALSHGFVVAGVARMLIEDGGRGFLIAALVTVAAVLASVAFWVVFVRLFRKAVREDRAARAAGELGR